MFKNRIYKLLLLVLVLSVIGTSLFFFTKTNSNNIVLDIPFDSNQSSPKTEVHYYQNNILTNPEQLDDSKDIKRIVEDNIHKTQELSDFANGFKVEVPSDYLFEFKYSPSYVRLYNDANDIKISRETSPYDDMDMYFKDYLNRFILNPEYQIANSIVMTENKIETINGNKTKIVSFYRKPSQGSAVKQNYYTFAYMITGKKQYYNFFFRSEKDTKELFNQTIKTFKEFKPSGQAVFALDLKPEIPKWNEETANFYRELSLQNTMTWGYFYPWAVTKPENYKNVEDVENKIDYKFPIILHYLYLGHDFPTEGMNRVYKDGKIVELTMQVASFNNDNNPRHNLNFDIIDGKMDDAIRKFARDAKAFKHPFLFRLNNEMNTDWAQYSGVMILSDADIYINVWQRIYNIFEEEGVDNAIWIFNPNHKNYPPANWNSHVAYYPGNKYVQILGITGYNTGDYFRSVTGEHWRSFNEIYSEMAAKYRPLYSKFPWIITEFASSSVGGDKAKWIKDMFRDIKKYPEIKAAVWWSYYDPDYREGKEDVPARRYWLDEKPEYLEIFKNELHK